MRVNTTMPVKELNKQEFKKLLFNKSIIICSHACDHLSTGQRKLFKEEEIINTIYRESPRKIFLQLNGRYAVYYRKRREYLKIILEKERDMMVIVSFMNAPEIPRKK